MPNPAIVGIGGSLLSGMSQSSAANKASKAQQASADAQIAESRRQFDVVQGLLKPYVGAGNAALDSMMALLGLGGLSATNGTLPSITTIPGASRPAANDPSNVSSLGGGRMGGRDGQSRAQVVNTPAGPKYSVNGQIFNTLEEAQRFAEANRTYSNDPAANQLAQKNAIDALANGSQFKALVGQGEEALLANAAATGGLRGGDTSGALAQFRPQMLQALIDKQLANLGGLAANGQNAAGGLGTAAQNTGAQVNAALGDKGAAQAGGYLARASAFKGMLGDVANGFGMGSGTTGGMGTFGDLFSSKNWLGGF
jgi:hypothetical protein